MHSGRLPEHRELRAQAALMARAALGVLMDEWLANDLFQIGVDFFYEIRDELLAYGLPIDPDLEIVRASGLLCYYSLTDGMVHLSIPEWTPGSISVFQMLIGSLFSASDDRALLRFLKLLVPRLIAHEVGHHLRHRADKFDVDNLWLEEQIANQLALALTKQRWSLEEREFAIHFLQTTLSSLAETVGAETIANDSYASVLQGLYAQGSIGTKTMVAIQAMEEMFDVEAAEVLRMAGVLEEDVIERLAGRDDLIMDFNTTYTGNQISYLYYQLGWLQVDLTSRETAYVMEFARDHLDITPNLLPHHPRDNSSSTDQVKACYRAFQKCERRSSVGGRYFYKRYRTELLERLQEANLGVPVASANLKRNGDYLLESWEQGQSDRMEMLAPLVPEHLRELLPSRIADSIPASLEVGPLLPTETDRRLYEHIVGAGGDAAAQETLERLAYLDRSELFRTLPAEVQMEVVHSMFVLRLARGEPIIWQRDRQNDVYIPVDGRFGYSVVVEEQEVASGDIPIGQVFGEMSFLTENPRSATVRALEPSRALVLKSTELSMLIHQHPAIIKRLAGVMVKRLARAGQELVQD
jgi:hypothetical protein